MIEVLKQALEALELHGQQYPHMVKGYCIDAITSLRQAIAEAEKQEPVVVDGDYIETTARWGKHFVEILDPTKKNEILRVYFEQLQRQWMGLTDEEIEQGCKESWVTLEAWQSAVWWAEERLKEKNT